MLNLVRITGKIRVKTGLRIGGSKDNVNIGGIDNIVTKNPADGKPYIPGSSIKGKMRFLMEWKKGVREIREGKGSVHNCDNPDCDICGLFGSTKFKENAVPTRLIVRDAYLEENIGDNILEEKVENSINRLNGRASSPRTMERVVPGTEFSFEMVLRLFDNDNPKKWKDLLVEALGLLQSDYLGSSGSRGYGKITFVSSDNTEGAVDIDGKERVLENAEE